MEHQIRCECGQSITVRETAAGTKAECRCGRSLTVPSLPELRRMAGGSGPVIAPEKAIEVLLLAKRLPKEAHCVQCGVATDHTAVCRVECERAVVTSGGNPLWVTLLAVLTFGWLGVLVAKSTEGEDREWGTDRTYDLPVRVCAVCAARLTSEEAVKDTLWRIPLYRELLSKYPRAKASPPGM
jgi:hypothetical protein